MIWNCKILKRNYMYKILKRLVREIDALQQRGLKIMQGRDFNSHTSSRKNRIEG